MAGDQLEQKLGGGAILRESQAQKGYQPGWS